MRKYRNLIKFCILEYAASYPPLAHSGSSILFICLFKEALSTD